MKEPVKQVENYYMKKNENFNLIRGDTVLPVFARYRVTFNFTWSRQCRWRYRMGFKMFFFPQIQSFPLAAHVRDFGYVKGMSSDIAEIQLKFKISKKKSTIVWCMKPCVQVETFSRYYAWFHLPYFPHLSSMATASVEIKTEYAKRQPELNKWRINSTLITNDNSDERLHLKLKLLNSLFCRN